MNIARLFSYTRLLERDLEITRSTIEVLLAKVPDFNAPKAPIVNQPKEFKVLRNRPMARDFIRGEEQRIQKEMNEPKSNIVEVT